MSISRKTKSVKLVLDVFSQFNTAISITKLITILKGKMNKTTVYRILYRLEDSSILHSFIGKDGHKRYAKSNQQNNPSKYPTPHPHFLCEDCGVSTCLPIPISAPSIPDYVINSSEQLHLGQCKDCQTE